MEKENEMNIDNILNKNILFWKELETECFVECCGIDAFDFSKENINRVINSYDTKVILQNLNEIIDVIQKSKKKNINSSVFNLCETKVEFITRIKALKKILKR